MLTPLIIGKPFRKHKCGSVQHSFFCAINIPQMDAWLSETHSDNPGHFSGVVDNYAGLQDITATLWT